MLSTGIKRILISLLLPPIMGAILFYHYLFIETATQYCPILFLPFLVPSFLFSGIQTLLYTVIMELLGRGLVQKFTGSKKIQYLFILIGTCLGGLAGLGASILSGFYDFRFILPGMGLFIGLIVTMLKLKLHLKQKEQSNQTDISAI